MASVTRIFFGVDPGSVATGYGVVRVCGNTVRWQDSGVITPRPKAPLYERLDEIFEKLLAKMIEHAPDVVCVEEAFYAKNVHTTLILGHARGVALLAARKSGAAVAEFSPREIKKAVVGNGNAQKEQVAFMIRTLFAPLAAQEKLDAYDALAVAMCGYYNHGNIGVRAVSG